MHRILSDARVAALEGEFGRDSVRRAAERALDRARAFPEEISFDDLVSDVVVRLEELRLKTLMPVVNATGIIVHTNLGRASLAPEALESIGRLALGYTNLEYDLQTGSRGTRYARVSAAINEVTGAEASLVVNNCAAAVLLILDTLAKGREVIVSRNQLIEIGGGFRVPEVLERSGAKLVEVGTTNRVYIEDFERALSPRTGLLLRTHTSNYRIEGFVHDVGGAELVQLGRRAGVPVVEDLGSGALVDLARYGVEHERTVGEAIADGFQLVAFSGDKLLGGPQAGIIVGRENLIARLRSNPLLRALRVDKLTLAALAATLRLYRAGLHERIPIYRMLAVKPSELRCRADALAAALPGAVVVDSTAYVGGGSVPQAPIPSIAVAIDDEKPDLLAACLRDGAPAIISRIEGGRVLLDLRTIDPQEDESVIAALARLAGSRDR